MEHIPPEICGEIFAFACADDGYTGRALSLVSRYFNDVATGPFNYQSVAIVGHGQLVAFADLIGNIPLPFRRVECIFISAHSRRLPQISTLFLQNKPKDRSRMLLSSGFCAQSPSLSR